MEESQIMTERRNSIKRQATSYPTMPRSFLPVKQMQPAPAKREQSKDVVLKSSWKKLFLML